MKKITYKIVESNLGDTTTAEADAYKVALSSAITAHYPTYAVSVEIVKNDVARFVEVTGTDEDTRDIEDAIEELASIVWEKGAW